MCMFVFVTVMPLSARFSASEAQRALSRCIFIILPLSGAILEDHQTHAAANHMKNLEKFIKAVF